MIGVDRGIFVVEWGVVSDLLLRKSANCGSKVLILRENVETYVIDRNVRKCEIP